MEYHPVYGPVVQKMDWVPAPSFLLRRERVLGHLSGVKTGKLLEVGCGAGTLLHELNLLGFDCKALEISNKARMIAKYVNCPGVSIHSHPAESWSETFDCLVALEVLEHIEDDSQALTQWLDWLRPEGILILSVPAHMSKWTVSDVWAGHYRRYEKHSLLELLASSGFTLSFLENYGFPLANMLLTLRAWVHAKELKDKDSVGDRKSNNDQSGVDRTTMSRFYPLLSSVPGVLAMRAAFLLQALTVKRDWGPGYLVKAVKPSKGGKNAA